MSLNEKNNEQNNGCARVLEILVQFFTVENNNVKWLNLALTGEREPFQIHCYVPDSVSW